MTIAPQAHCPPPPRHLPTLAAERALAVKGPPGAYVHQGSPLSYPAANCKSMLFVWNEATTPVPPAQPPQSHFPALLFEGWWYGSTPASGPRRFAVKAVWKSDSCKAIMPPMNGFQGRIFMFYDPEPLGGRFNYIGPGSDQSHMEWVFYGTWMPGFQDDYTIAITSTGSGNALQSELYLLSGLSRLSYTGSVTVRNPDKSCPAGYYCPPLADCE